MNKPIFIGGCDRSGTTMLSLILHAHKNIAIPPETKYIKKLYKRRILFGDLSKKKNREKIFNWFYEHHNENTKLIDLKITKEEVQKELEKSGNTLGSILAAALKVYAKKNRKPRWGDKHPYYIKYVDQIFNLYPDAQFIHILRDGRDAVSSIKTMPWWKFNSIYAMLTWQEAIKQGQKAKKKYSKEQFLEIRYEDLIRDPVESIKYICNFLNEEYSQNLLNFYQISDSVLPNYKMEWHSNTKSKINMKRIGRWQQDLNPWEQALFNKIFKKQLLLHGYKPQKDTASIPIKKQLLYWSTKVKYKSLQYSVTIMDKIYGSIYPWKLDYRT